MRTTSVERPCMVLGSGAVVSRSALWVSFLLFVDRPLSTLEGGRRARRDLDCGMTTMAMIGIPIGHQQDGTMIPSFRLKFFVSGIDIGWMDRKK